MSAGAVLVRALVGWAVATALGCVLVHHAFTLEVDEAHPRAVVASVWAKGERVGRAWVERVGDRDPALESALASHPGATLAYESVVAEGPIATFSDATFALSFVPGRDGLTITWHGHTEAVTPDDLLSRQAYDQGLSIPAIGVTTGVDVPLVLALASDRFGASARDLRAEGRFRRIRAVRTIGNPTAPPVTPVTPSTLTSDAVREAAIAAGAYLARGVDEVGRFRYLVDAPTNRTAPGYDWPRHAGATYFLAQAAALSGEGQMAFAALRAAGYLRDRALVACGDLRCIGSDRAVDLGSAALADLAFVEIVRTGLDAGYGEVARDLTAFLRSQQRADGEFMHLYDREERHPVDVQFPYYSGEAALALARANAAFGDSRDLDAARRSVAYLTGPGWSFFGSRYYFAEEHWTCQAMADLWDRAPDPRALDFCLRWQAFNRRLQFGVGDSPFDADGAFGAGPLLTPRLTPVGSRSEAGIATLAAARQAGVRTDERAALESQLRRSLALLLRHQLRSFAPTPYYLFADPQAVDGAMPGSAVDWRLRIDYAQHTGSALVRWLSLEPGGSSAPRLRPDGSR